jgi:hypothetical protein
MLGRHSGYLALPYLNSPPARSPIPPAARRIVPSEPSLLKRIKYRGNEVAIAPHRRVKRVLRLVNLPVKTKKRGIIKRMRR